MGWQINSGELWVDGAAEQGFEPFRLCRFSDVPMCVSTYSKGGEWSGELVDVGRGLNARDYEGRDVRGKVALASGYAADVVRQAVIARGAVGAVIYPDALDRPSHPDMVRYNGVWTRADEIDKTSGSFQISATQYARLKGLLARGPVRVRGKIDATLGPGRLTLVHAWIRGSQPEREILVTAHLDHPKWSANDNASGSGAMIEMARTVQALIEAKRAPPPRESIHFMWVPEYFGTLAYFDHHPEARSCGAWDDPRPAPTTRGPCIVANINLDMVGEDTVKTNSRFYMTRTPDSVPGSLNALLEDLLAQTREADLVAPSGSRNTWPAAMIPYVQGSDHDILLGLGIPASMLGHDPDWTHHTSEDTIDKTDATEFRRVGALATAATLWMATRSDLDSEHANRREAAARLGVYAARLARNAGGTDSFSRDRAAVAVDRMGKLSTAVSAARAGGTLDSETRSRTGPGPRRATLLPLDASAFDAVAGSDRAWFDQQSARFTGGETEGLPIKPTFDLLIFETINFMGGLRDTRDIARMLSSEYDLDIDQAWVDRLVAVLRSVRPGEGPVMFF